MNGRATGKEGDLVSTYQAPPTTCTTTYTTTYNWGNPVYIGLGTLVFILVVLAIIYLARRA